MHFLVFLEDLDDDLDNTKITVQATCKTRMNIPKTTTNNNVVSLNYNSQQQEQPLSITDNSSSKNMHCIGENTQGEFASSSMNKYKYQKRAGKKDTKGTSKGFQMLSTRTVR